MAPTALPLNEAETGQEGAQLIEADGLIRRAAEESLESLRESRHPANLSIKRSVAPSNAPPLLRGHQ